MSQNNLQSYPRLKFDDQDNPTISLPPPTTTRGHVRSRTTTDLSPSLARSHSLSPTRSSTIVPFRSSRSTSPKRLDSKSEGSVSPTTEVPTRPKIGAVGRLASWFEGSSDPVSISLVPTANRQQAESFYKVEGTESAGTGSRNNLTPRASKRMTASPSTANSSMFSFFKRPVSQAQSRTISDDLATLDIKAALAPNDIVEDFSPAAFDMLRQNAEALLMRFQTAHVDNMSALRQIRSDKNVQGDELEACQTRNEHLKMQLLDMAEKAAAQEKSIVDLTEQLDKHQQSIRMITEDELDQPRHHRRSRHSDYSFSGDSVTDSEMGSAVSIFSEIGSIRSHATSIAASPVIKDSPTHNPVLTVIPVPQAHATTVLVPDCSKCHGVLATEAWDVIEIMKIESQGLKQRVSELESAQDAALDFLSGLNV